MKLTRLVACALIFASTSSLALAAATAEEAGKIKASLQSYLGSEPGVVEVVPSGDDYVITLDAAPYLKKIAAPEMTASVSPWKITVKPEGNGIWQASSNEPMSVSFKADPVATFDMRVAAMDWKGTFDESLGGFTASSYTANGITVAQDVKDPQNVNTSVAYGIESITGSSTSTHRGDGVADSVGSFTFSGVTSVTKSAVPPEMAAAGMPNLDYTANIAKGEYKTSAKGLRMRALLDLVAWFVARPSKELIVKDQAQLKEKLATALPLFENIESTGTFDTLSVGTALGQFNIASGGSGVAMNGAVKDGKFGESINLTGLAIPPGLAPPWATDLVPHTFKLDFSVSGFDAEAPAKMVLAQIDLAKDEPLPQGFEALLMPAFLPANTVNVTLNPGEISAPAYSLTYDAAIGVNLAGLPTVKANIKMKGIEAVLEKVQAAAATDQVAQHAMGGLVAAKGFGKADADGSMVWVVEFGADGKLMINGIDMTAMMGGAPPPAPAQ